MLKLSNKGLYSIKAIYELAINFGKNPVNIKDISSRHGMPVSFLVQVLHTLKKKGLVMSRRGVNGGYVLALPPDQITIGDVVRAIEGPIALCDCIAHVDSDQTSERAKNCVTMKIYQKLSKKVEDTLDSVTISDIAEESIESTLAGTCKHTPLS